MQRRTTASKATGTGAPWLGRGGVPLEVQPVQLLHAVGGEREPPCEQLIDQHAQRVDVDPVVDGLARICSGAMAQGVPSRVPKVLRAMVSMSGRSSLAMPKSSSLSTFSPLTWVNPTLLAFRSRCTTPAAWAASSAEQSGTRTSRISAGDSRPRRFRIENRSVPSSSSITK